MDSDSNYNTTLIGSNGCLLSPSTGCADENSPPAPPGRYDESTIMAIFRTTHEQVISLNRETRQQMISMNRETREMANSLMRQLHDESLAFKHRHEKKLSQHDKKLRILQGWFKDLERQQKSAGSSALGRERPAPPQQPSQPKKRANKLVPQVQLRAGAPAAVPSGRKRKLSDEQRKRLYDVAMARIGPNPQKFSGCLGTRNI